MYQGRYINTTDLIRRLNPKTFLAIYDDEDSGDPLQVDDLIVQQDIDSAEGEVDSYLILIGTLPLPTLAGGAIDRLIKTAALDYAEALSFLRHPEYPRTFGENGKSKGLWTIAEKRMERIKKSLQQMPDIVSQTGTTPTNTGATIANADPEADDEDPKPKFFESTGIF